MSEMYEFPEEYQKAWDAYFYPGTNVLKNKLGITDYDELARREQIQSMKNVGEMVNIILAQM